MNYYPAAQVAEIIHASMMALQRAQQDRPSPPWDSLTPEVRANAIAGVEAVRKGMTPEENHERWAAQLRSQGWKRGEAKDPYAKTHPLLRPWDELTESAKDRDRLFVHMVLALSMPADIDITISFQVPVSGVA